jgi:predicted O-methyltransferase YrrM
LSWDPGLLNDIKGFFDDEEGRALRRLCRSASRLGPCLEIGSYCGKSTVYLGTACRENGAVLFSVDHHRGSEEQQPGEMYFDPELYCSRNGCVDTFPYFRRTLERSGLADTVVPLVCSSELAARAWRTPLGLVFIDGGHALETVFRDYCAWAPHILPGGFLVFHDIFLDPKDGGQAPRQVYAMAAASRLFEPLPVIQSLGALRRVRCEKLSENAVEL